MTDQFRVYITTIGSRIVSEVDAIEHAGRVWIVPRWRECGDDRFRQPERMIPVDRFEHHAVDVDHRNVRYAVTTPIPATLLGGSMSEEFANEHGVVLSPGLLVPRASQQRS